MRVACGAARLDELVSVRVSAARGGASLVATDLLQGGDMTHRSILSRLAITSLAVALLATAPASAMPIDPAGTAAKDPQQQDMHASTVHAPKAGSAVQDA